MPHANRSKHEPRARLRALVASGRTVAVPGATDALSAKLIESHGFEAVYIGSYATAASRYALPDTGLLSLDHLGAQARTIANAVGVPVIADAEGGFNDPANMWRTVRALECFKSTRDANAVPGYRASVRAFEDFMGYREFAECARRYDK